MIASLTSTAGMVVVVVVVGAVVVVVVVAMVVTGASVVVVVVVVAAGSDELHAAAMVAHATSTPKILGRVRIGARIGAGPFNSVYPTGPASG